jgi:SAM-dependent methyltransferase
MFVRRFLARLQRSRRSAPVLSSSGEPWMRDVLQCQEIIAASDPYPHYPQAYRDEEISYWHHIPKWIYEDREKYAIERCLDIGCAYGTLALFCKRLLKCPVYCTDFTDRYISQSLAETQGLVFAKSNIELDPLPWEGPFDLVVFTEVLEHLNFHPVPTLTKIRDLLSGQGRLYLSTPDASEWGRTTKYYRSLHNIPQPQAGLPVIDDHIYHYSRKELLAVFDAAGLAVQRLDYSPGVGKRHFNFTVTRKQSDGSDAS